ncbi:hypothetical protein EG329_000853 [Mollisiaceae sp. DMI_Dod_QoI]|nr:hypothetical protein EG329_000853 [Helotiales sp. DMI_Dod_QoI]
MVSSALFRRAAKLTSLALRQQIHTTSVDSVKIAEVREAVHATKDPQLSFQAFQGPHFSNIPPSKISREIKAANAAETARARAREMDFREVHGRVQDSDLYNPMIKTQSPTSSTRTALTATGEKSTNHMNTAIIQTRTMANSARIAKRIQDSIASGRSAADLDSAF